MTAYTDVSAPAGVRGLGTRLGLGLLLGALVVVGGATATDWAPVEDWQLPAVVLTLAVGAALITVGWFSMRAVVVGTIAALVLGFLSMNTGPLQPRVFASYGRLVQLTTGHPLCAEGKVLNKAETACIRNPKAKPAPKPRKKASR